MKKPGFYLLYLILLVVQASVLVWSLGLFLTDWQTWAIMLTTIFGAASLTAAYT